MRVVFFGNSDVSTVILEKLTDLADVLTITSSDKPAGRGLKRKPNPVKLFCMKEKLRFVEFDSTWNEVEMKIREFKPDFLVVASFGRIIPESILSLLPERRRINVHPSLLPRWRGPAPVQWTILSGDEETGITICTVVEKPDAGDIIFQERVKLRGNERASELQRKLFELSSRVIPDIIKIITYGEANFVKQDDKRATWARLIKKEDGYFSFSEHAGQIWRKFRAFDVWPKIFTSIKGENVIVHDMEPDYSPTEKIPDNAEPGYILGIDEKGIHVLCGNKTAIFLKKLQRPGRKVMSGKDFANGLRLKKGDML